MALRSFVLVNVNGKSPKKCGRYLGSSASSSVKKAFNELLKSKKSKSKSKSVSMVLTLRESTEGSKKKEYKYKVKRVVLKEPRVVELKNGDQIVYRYDTKVKKA
jgi:hypothetical protein